MILNHIKALGFARDAQQPLNTYLCPFIKDNDIIPDVLEPIPFFNLFTHQIPQYESVAFLWHTPESLHVLCVMVDPCPHSNANLKFDKTWEKGDLCELFFMPHSKNGNYYELHIAPNQATLELNIPNASKLRAGEYPFESLFFESKMIADAYIFANGEKQGWWAHFEVPKSLFESQLEPDNPPLFMIGRYNYHNNTENPEISATSIFPSPKFHQPQYWTSLKWGSQSYIKE